MALILMMYTFDRIYSTTFKNKNPRNKVHKILQLENKHYDMAFLGSSRTECHVDCELIEEITGKSCINLGMSGASLGDMLILLSLAETNNITFESLAIQIDYNFYNTGLSNTFKANLVPFIQNPIVKKELNKDNDNFYYNNIPFYRYMKYDKIVGFREFFATLFNKKPRSEIKFGFNPKKGQGLAIHGKLPDSFVHTNRELEAIKELAERNETKLHLFTAPYCQNINNRIKLLELKNDIPTILSYVNVFDNKEGYFFDCAHLNHEGAREFTKILIKDISKLSE
ncbi:hypothetical protein [uncultured Algibacter sp.]|uniref:hypothetical protein n=1 Tax=uncultured Algibacter sp. TaxID=298659 RepID=UPI00262B5376|nr:hypothetical protein [uncultured Algibacter sp.]